VSQVDLACTGLDPLLDLEIAVADGVLSPTNVPLRDINGDTTFMVSLPGVASQCRYWTPTGDPSF
jgi:hypothetical protein